MCRASCVEHNIIKPPIYASLFADDAKLLYSFKPTESCLPLQCALDELSDWMKRWELEIAPTKCVVMRIGNKNPVHSYFINDFECLYTPHSRIQA